MFRRSRSTRFLVVLAAGAAVTSMTGVSHAAYQPPTELTGDGGPVRPLKYAAMIEVTGGGYRYISGQQNGHLTITEVDGKLLYSDTGTGPDEQLELRDIPSTCREQPVPTGIAALCDIPTQFENSSEIYLEVWPRLGDDFVDGSTLSARFRLWTLADKGNDTVLGGAGRDFVNGAQDNDKAWGGAGDDWIRTGLGNDELWGEAGNDRLVGVYDDDVIHGGDGDDRVGGGPGSDVLWADAGRDNVICGAGPDEAHVDGLDSTTRDCESVAID